MRKTPITVYALLLVLCAYTRTYAQDFREVLVPEAEKVRNAYLVLEKNRLAVSQQILFLQAFPDTKDKFIRVFDRDDKKQLHKQSRDYIDAVEKAGDILPDSVLKVTLGIAKQMRWSPGVSDQLQHTILIVAANHPEIFVERAYMLKRKELDGLIAYLSDVESNPLCAIYQKLIANLHEVGAYNLEGMLQRAKVSTH